jgi:magnesium-transporting ATPase (P-type)
MKLYNEIVTRDAEVRIGQRWVCTDATSLVRGDIIKLRVSSALHPSQLELHLFVDHALTVLATNALQKACSPCKCSACVARTHASQRRQRAPADARIIDSAADFAYDASEIVTTAGRATRGCTDATAPSADLSDNVVPCGALVLEGEAIGVVVATGAYTLLGRLIRGT